MYKELEKYKTNKKVESIGVLPDKTEIKIYLNEYVFGLGDLIDDYIEHKNKSIFKRKYYHSHLTRIYKKMLNTVLIKNSL